VDCERPLFVNLKMTTWFFAPDQELNDHKDAKNIFDGFTLTIADDRFDYGEQRFVSFGIIYDHVIAVVHLETEKVIRIISARKATKNEQKGYFKQVPH